MTINRLSNLLYIWNAVKSYCSATPNN